MSTFARCGWWTGRHGGIGPVSAPQELNIYSSTCGSVTITTSGTGSYLVQCGLLGAANPILQANAEIQLLRPS